jgi:tetratricopeptide (TPR) repeat protein
VTAGDYYQFGQEAEQRGDVKTAIADYREAVTRGPEAAHEKSLYRLGVLYMDQKQYREAARAWEKYLALDPLSAEGWNNLGQAYEQGGEIAKAEAAYKRGIAADPEDHSCRVNYGLMLARHGREAEGMEQLQGVMKPAEAHYSLGTAYEQAGEAEKAKQEYRKALELDPTMQAARDKVGENP